MQQKIKLLRSQQSYCLFTLVKVKKIDMIEVVAMRMQKHAKFLTEYIFCSKISSPVESQLISPSSPLILA